MQFVFLVLEVLCILLVAVGCAVWLEPGVGLVVGGGLGLVLLVAAQLPDRPVG